MRICFSGDPLCSDKPPALPHDLGSLQGYGEGFGIHLFDDFLQLVILRCPDGAQKHFLLIAGISPFSLEEGDAPLQALQDLPADLLFPLLPL